MKILLNNTKKVLKSIVSYIDMYGKYLIPEQLSFYNGKIESLTETIIEIENFIDSK